MQNVNDNFNLTPEELALEQSLSALRPLAPAIDRDALLYAAGLRSAPRAKLWPWQTAAALSLTLAMSLLFLNPLHTASPQTAQPALITSPQTLAATQLPFTNYPLPATPLPVAIAADFPYLAARQNALALGLSTLPNLPSGPTSPLLHPNDLNTFTTQ